MLTNTFVLCKLTEIFVQELVAENGQMARPWRGAETWVGYPPNFDENGQATLQFSVTRAKAAEAHTALCPLSSRRGLNSAFSI